MDPTEKSRPPPYDIGFNNQPYGNHNPQAPPPQAMGSPGPQGSSYYPPPGQMPMYAPAPAHTPAPVQTTSNTTVVVNSGVTVRGCPICHNNSWTGSYSCCAWMWLICCFPVGIICCCCMKRQKCTHCGYTVG